MYELLIKLYDELDYKKFTIKDLEEMREIVAQFTTTEEINLRHIKEEGDNGKTK